MYDGTAAEAFEDFEEVEARQQFTVTVASDLIVATAHGLSNTDPVTFVSTGALPDGLKPEITYYVINATANDFQVEADLGSATAVVINDTGTGISEIVQDESRFWTEVYT